MNILQIAPRVPFPLYDGGKIGIFNITKYLSLRGHKITLLSLTSTKESTELYELEKFCKVKIIYANTKNSYFKMLINIFSPLPYTMFKYYNKDFEMELCRLLREESFDIVHIDSLHMAYYVKMVKENFDIPVVLREHNVESVIMRRYSQNETNPVIKAYASMQFRKIYKYESKILQAFDLCLMITKEDEKRIKAMNPLVKTTVVPGGVDTSYFYPLEEPVDEKALIFVGTLDWIPNIDGILWFCKSIFPLIKKQEPFAKLYIVGKNPPPKILALRCESIIVTGFVEDVRPYISKASVFVVPLRVGGGMRIKILEAFSMAKAVVSTSIGCEGIDVENGKDIYIEDNEDKFAKRVVELMRDREKRSEIGRNAFELVKTKYTWETVSELIEGEYNKLINRGNLDKREEF